ncbi:shikimate dehydrogenase [Planctomycetaceae bacterium SH139]
MICVSVGRTRHKHTIAEYHHLAEQGVELVELRLDFIGRSINLTRLLKDRPCPVVITCRRREDGGRWQKSEQERLMLLRNAIATGVEYVDLEADVAATIPRYGSTKRIVSHHDFVQTPENLADLHRHLAAQEADIVKIATMANTVDDTLRMMDLARNAKIPTIAICMGELGTSTRILAGRLGAPFTYASFSTDRRLAPGQLNYSVMRDLYRYDEIGPATQLFGVVADPVGHSHSPLIHNAAFAAQEIDARYLPFQVPIQDLEQFIKAAPGLGIRGLSVTIPHKEYALDLMTQAEAAASGIGAINTIVFDGDQRLGYNTDYRAAMECIAKVFPTSPHEELPWMGKRALILGAGGVSRAIGWGLHQKGVAVTISSRTHERAHALAEEIGGDTVMWDKRHEPQVDLLVNGTPVGMHPDLDNTPFRAESLNPKTVVFETIYNPERTLLVKNAHQVGCTTITGVEMFVRQAAYQYRLFTDRDAPIDLMRDALKLATNPVRLNINRHDDEGHADQASV